MIDSKLILFGYSESFEYSQWLSLLFENIGPIVQGDSVRLERRSRRGGKSAMDQQYERTSIARSKEPRCLSKLRSLTTAHGRANER